ncbi:HD domain-containing phosphohydrolase [Desulfosarcina sp.]|uniref:HD domain-containing phosphohydrolase n=1 Tax=Desulfosarcina sp. TaxID=2027861 RepID=UPI0039707E6C
MNLKVKRYPFYIGITTLVVVIVITLTGLFLWISHRESKAAAIHMADRLFSEINAKTLERYERTLESVAVLVGLAARIPGMATAPEEAGTSHPGIELMIKALDFYDYIFSTYLGYDNGSFIQIVAVRDQPELRLLFDAPPGAAYILRTIFTDSQGLKQQRWRFLNLKRQVIGKIDNLDPDFDPRSRPWYIQAGKLETAFFTEPYIFSSTKVPGITCAQRLLSGGGVFGADITLDRFSISLERQKVSDNGRLFLFDRTGRVIAHPTENPIKTGAGETLSFLTGEESADPLVRAIVAEYRAHPEYLRNRTLEIMINSATYLVRSTAFKTDLKFDHILASTAPLADFTGHIRRMQQRIYLFSGLVLLVVMPLALLVSRKISGSLIQLEKESRKIQQSDFSESKPFDSSIKEIHSLIKAFVLMKSTIRDYTARLIQAKQEIEDLFTAVTELLAGAIDAKSPYTGGHCKRVPVVAKMIAMAAHESTDAPFANFRMDAEDKRREFEVAAWLHDCGKVTTPEHVVDKATKLETIYNRIHEIRMRFEVLLRDAEIDFYRQRLAGNADGACLEAQLEKRHKQIADDFAFVAACNIGGEFMPDEKIERLEEIAARTWVRHLDDRMGISQDETALKNRQPRPTLPVVEHVLTDKPEHIIPRPNPDPFEGNTYGFNMAVPENQYNLGELYNLAIRKGTLSPEDRFKINEHIIQTIIMLRRLPFPENMKHVAEIAGAHHETMIGNGYPRGLKKEEMSIPARIMAIADIFEALTAADRPYKKPKTLNEALRIMSRMRNDRHIDAELFDLFLQSGVYQTYAEQFLDPAQMDAVDIRHYLSSSHA